MSAIQIAAVSTWQVVLIYIYMGVSQGRSGTNVPRLDIYRSIILSEITHQIMHVHPFSQRNKTSKIAGGGEVGSNGKIGWTKL